MLFFFVIFIIHHLYGRFFTVIFIIHRLYGRLNIVFLISVTLIHVILIPISLLSTAYMVG